jgi:hypothetical protein
MPAYSDDEPPRPRRSRRPEYREQESDTSEDLNHPPPKPRQNRQSRPSKREEQSAPPKRRPSILRDPDETASQRETRRPRSHSNVRLRTPDSDSESATQDPRRRPRGPPKSGKSRIDLESKEGPKYKQFREKRDGYTSEEGEMLRNAAKKSSRPREPDYDDIDGYDGRGKSDRRPRDDREPRPDRGPRPDREPRPDRGLRPDRDARPDRPDRDPRSDREPPRREKPRGARDVAEGAAGAAAGAAFAENSRMKSRRTYKDDPRDRQGYDDDDDDEPPRRRPSRREDPRRDDPREPRRSAPEMSGYRSDAAPPRRRERRRDDDDDDEDRYDRKRRDDRSGGGRDARPPRPQDYYSDHRDDRARRSDPRDRRPKNPARENYREDDRYRDYDKRRGEDDYGRSSSKPKKAGGLAGLANLGNLGKFDFKDSAWQKEATAAFMTYALPVIKKEGTKYARREMQKYMEKQGGGRR